MSKSQLNSAPTSFMLMIPQEEWQSLHDKLDRLIEIVEKTQIGSPGKDWFESDEVRKILGILNLPRLGGYAEDFADCVGLKPVFAG
ncbi:hypothetical protein, partial [uncultured Duncaniella sp.]|uniref:hypothetical protein n=1 Tax=uncultured Duncaniella sp. TaxID=2768039 RepID=UPI002711E941